MNRISIYAIIWAAGFFWAGSLLAMTDDELITKQDATLGNWRISGEILRPDDDEYWDSAYGGEVQFVNWLTPQRGIGFAVGLQSWKANDTIYTYAETWGRGAGFGYAGGLTGKATMIPVTVSGVFRYDLDEKWLLTAEVKLSYVVVNSSVKYEEYAVVMRNNQIVAGEGYVVKADIKDNIMFGTGIHLHYQPAKSDLSFFGGVTGQFDLSKGNATLPATPLSGEARYKNELRAIGFRAGMTAAF